MTMDSWRDDSFCSTRFRYGDYNPVNAIMLQGENIVPEEINQSVEGIETATKQEAINGLTGIYS